MTPFFSLASVFSARAPKWLDYAVLCAFTLLVYANVYSNGYVWDDHFQIESNAYLTSLPKLLELFLNDNWKLIAPDIGAVGYWRPLYFVSYYLDTLLPVSQPLGHLLMNVFYYLMVCMLLLKFIRTQVKDRLASFLGALVFSLWPLHTEAIAFVGGRSFLLCSLFWISAMLLFQDFWKQGQLLKLMACIIFYTMSLMVYEAAIVLPLLVCFYIYKEWYSLDVSLRFQRLLISGLGFTFLTAAYLGFRKWVVPLQVYGPSTLESISFSQSAQTCLRVLRGLTAPYFFTVVEDPSRLMTEPWATLLGGILFVLWVSATLVLTYQRSKWSTCLSWSLLPCLLVISPWPRGSIYQDRYTFLPSIGLSLAIAMMLVVLEQRVSKKMYAMILMVGSCILLSFMPTTLARNLDWRSDEALWCTEATSYPASFQANINCAWAHKKNKNYQQALNYYDKALTLHMDVAAAKEYASLLAALNRCDEALKIFKILRHKDPSAKDVREKEALCLALLGRHEESKFLIDKK